MIVVGLLVFLGGVIGVLLGGSSGSSPNVVKMRRYSFDPRVLTVSRGATVRFENVSGTDKWPASNFHPTHQLYPGFDAAHTLRNGESYSFKFERVGRWGYHDHLSPNIQATIVVTTTKR